MKKKMKNKKIALTISLLAIFLAILVVPTITAANMVPVLTFPLNGTNHSEAMIATCTVTNGQARNFTLNVTFFANSTDGTATNFTIGDIDNSTVNQSVFTNAAMSIAAQDGLLYAITCMADNGTDQEWSNPSNKTTFDSTVPICSLKGDHVTIPYKGTILLTWTSSDALLLSTTSTTIDGPQAQTTITDTSTNDERTLTSQETKYWGDWIVSVTATDTAANTCTAYFNFSSYLPNGEIWESGEPKAPIDMGKTALLLLIVGVVAYFVFFNKKK